jgi:ABC-type amino acid transport system permease subunit
MTTSATPTKHTARSGTKLPSVRIGLVAGLTGILCCVGPTVLALFGVVTAGTAYVWANNLYDGYAWLFRGAGLLLLVGLVVLALRRRNQCSIAGARKTWPRLLMALGIAAGTYAALYALTTWLGTFA